MNSFYRYIIPAIFLILAVTSSAPSAWAQAVIPGSADAARAIPDFVMPQTPLRHMEGATTIGKAVSLPPSGAENTKFILSEIQINGMQAYTPEDIRPIYSRYLGHEISLKILFDIIADVHNKYLKDGYTLTRVFLPAQNIQNGLVRIEVVEGYVSKLDLAEGIEPSPAMDDAVKRIINMRPLNTVQLERILLIINDLPHMQVSAILGTLQPGDPGAGEAGAVHMTLQNSPKQEATGEIGLNNYGSVFSGPGQVDGALFFYDLLGKHDTLQLSGTAALPVNEQRIVVANYKRPLFGVSGTLLSLMASKARTMPGDSLKSLDIQGSAETVSAGVSYPVIRQRGKSLTADIGFDIKNANTDIIGAPLYKDRLRVIHTGVNYNASDRFAGVNLLDLHYSQGLDFLGSREKGAGMLSRLDGDLTFHKVNAMFGRLQSLPQECEVSAIVQAQHSFEPLLSAEEFGFGGEATGRGYNPSEITGDRGISVSLEIKRNIQYQITGFNTQLQPYGFYDLGKVWNIDNNDTVSQSAASIGFGTRINIENQWNIDINIAFPLSKEPENPPHFASEHGPRLLFGIKRRF